MNTFTLAGKSLDAKNNPAYAGRYMVFRITSVGSDTAGGASYPRESVDMLIAADGTFGGDLWVNGDSGIECLYEVTEPSGQRIEIVFPSAVDGTTVRYEFALENYLSNASTAQQTPALAVHIADQSNPHAVTPSQLGLVIGTDVQAYDPTILVDSDIGVNVQAYDSTILVDSDIGSTVQAQSATLDATTASYTTAEETKLAGIEALAEVNDPTTVLDADIGVTVQAYSSTLDGTTASYTAAEETKLAGIETGATADQSDAEIKTAYENNSDTNAFTDADNSKLAGIEALAEVNDPTTVLDADIGVNVQAHNSILDTVETTITDTDTAIPTSGAVVDYVASAGGAVDSVNGATGVVVVDGTDIELVDGGGTTITTAVSDLDSTKADKATLTRSGGNVTGSIDTTANTFTLTSPGGGSGDVATDTIWDSAGDLVVGTGSNAAVKLPIGTNGQVLTSNGTTATWASSGAGDLLSTNNLSDVANTTTSLTNLGVLVASGGVNIGDSASATNSGAAIGKNASASTGGAVGTGALATTGFAGGESALADGAGRVQLGTGTNATDSTIQFLSSGSVTATEFGRLAGTSGSLYSEANIISDTTYTSHNPIEPNEVIELTKGVTGAAVGDSVMVGAPSTVNAGLVWCAFVSSANVVKLRVHNTTGANINLDWATWRFTVVKY